MKTLKLNPNTWHASLATNYRTGSYATRKAECAIHEGGEIDMCTYLDAMLQGFLTILICLVLFAGLSTVVIETILFIWVAIAYQTLLIGATLPAIVGIMLIGFALVYLMIICLFGIISYIIDYFHGRRKYKKQKEDSFIKNAFRGWREKFCAKIEFNNGTKT